MRHTYVDTESDYSDDISLKVQGTHNYARHPDGHIYMVSIITDDFEYVGPLETAPWDKISGDDWIWWSHNYFHEQEIFAAAREKGQMPEWAKPKEGRCSSDLAAWLGYPRSLAGACEALFDRKVSKDVRNKMSGVKFASLPKEKQDEVAQYCLEDSRYGRRIVTEYAHTWPDWEVRLSQLTRASATRGVLLDKPRLERYIGWARQLVWKAHRDIPWADEAPALSYKRLCEECRKVGIEPPPSLAMDDPACEKWEDTYGEQYPWVFAMRTKRRANTQLKKLEAIYARIRKDGRICTPLKYCGSSTKRWSGDGGVNWQNLGRDALLTEELRHYQIIGPDEEGIDMRSCIIAPPGKKFVICDLASIEPLCTLQIAGDFKTLNLIKSGMNIYEAHARATMNYTHEKPLKKMAAEDPAFARLRQLAKARVIGLGYGCGPERFVEVAKTIADLTITLAEAKTIVADFRASNPKIVMLWRKLQTALKRAAVEPEKTLTLELPSGNTLVYRDVSLDPAGGYTARVCKNGKMIRVKYFGAKLLENLVQSICRDIFALGMLRIDEAGYDIVMQTHDEVVVEVDESVPKSEVERLLCIPPPWMNSIPLASESLEGATYCK